MEKIQRCDRCQREFYRKYVTSQATWSKLNDVHYWTEGKDWNGCKILCRSCLKDWKNRHTDDFIELVSKGKISRFNTYVYNGLLDRSDLVEDKK